MDIPALFIRFRNNSYVSFFLDGRHRNLLRGWKFPASYLNTIPRGQASRRFSGRASRLGLMALSFEFCLTAMLSGLVENCALWRAAASNAGICQRDLRKDIVPPGTRYGVNEERTSPGARLFTLVGYYYGEGLSRDNVSIRQLMYLAQNFFNWLIESLNGRCLGDPKSPRLTKLS